MSKQHRNNTRRLDFRIPSLWNCWGYDGPVCHEEKQLRVDPRDYFQACLKWIHAQNPSSVMRSGKSLSRILARQSHTLPPSKAFHVTGGDWIRQQNLYAMMTRTTAAWDHDGNGRLREGRYNELGTFVKSILLLPLLHQMGMTMIYSLPVVKISHLFRKGALGCPYSTRNFLQLEPALHDPIYSENPADVTEEFKLFVECCHRLGMRVMLDFALRTTARDSDWILDHPDWFYWIDRKCERRYNSPRLPHIQYINATAGKLHEIYRDPIVQEHLRQFRFAPNMTEPKRWAKFADQARQKRPLNLLAEIAKHFGVVTPPGFSDCINDPQPPWSDVTFLRLHLDHPTEAKPYLPPQQPPYVLFDTIKASIIPTARPNLPLWRQLANVIPFYQRLGIDGVRLDMAHALPHELEQMILRKPRQIDPDFCFLAEDLGSQHHAQHRKTGYNIAIGPAWYMIPRASEGSVSQLAEQIHSLKVPMLACSEMPDTPRTVIRPGGKLFAQQAAVLSFFIPNGVPMISTGQEVFERQPMNLGLDLIPPGRHALPKNDPQAGRLAFFDPYAIHWNNAGGAEMIEQVSQAAACRREHLATLTRPRCYYPPAASPKDKKLLALGFRRPRRGPLLVLANFDWKKSRSLTIGSLPAGMKRVDVLLQLHSSPLPKIVRGRLVTKLDPGEVMVLLLV